jgi:tripartite-type tricarboxylate transporter receptor subunit TctC
MVRQVMRSVVIAAVALVMTGAVYAQSFPTRPITVIIAQPAGSAVDAITRVYSDFASKSMGQPIIVENRPGGGGIIAVQNLKHSSSDGYTLLVIANGPLTIEPWTRTLPYDVAKDFEPVAVLFGFSQFLAVSAESPANSVKDLVSFAKMKPGGLTYSTLGVGSITHLLCSMVARDSGTSMQHVPYTSISQYLLDLATNRVDFTFSSYQSTNSLMHEKRLKYLATTAQGRSALAPDVPTTAEAGFPDLNLMVWFGLLAPAGTPASVVQKLYEEFAKASRDPQTAQRLMRDGIDGTVASPVETKALITSEGTKMDRLIREFNIRVD